MKYSMEKIGSYYDAIPILSTDWEPLPFPLSCTDYPRLPYEMGLSAVEGRSCYRVDFTDYHPIQPYKPKPKEPKKKKKKIVYKEYEWTEYRKPEPVPYDNTPDILRFLSGFGTGEKYLVILSLYFNNWQDGVTTQNATAILEELGMNNIAERKHINGSDHWYMNEAFRHFVDNSI